MNLDLLSFLPTDCLVATDYQDKLLLATLLPLAVVVLTLGWRAIVVARSDEELMSGYGVKAMLIMLFFILPPVSNIICSTFGCRKFYDGTGHDEFMYM